jgi:hypothetical protein
MMTPQCAVQQKVCCALGGFEVVAVESYSEAMDRLSELGRRADLVVGGAITDS